MRLSAVEVSALQVLLAGCAPIEDPSADLSVVETAALIERTPHSSLTPETVAEAFALGTRATDVQREIIKAELVGHVVEWALLVYDVEYTDGRYAVTSQPIPIADTDAVPLLRVKAFVVPQSEADRALLQAVKTDDVIRIRGMAQEIRLRTVVVLVPGVVVRPAETDTNALSRDPSWLPARGAGSAQRCDLAENSIQT
jgi:hypothetical protein